MPPVEIDTIPRSIPEVEFPNFKIVEKALELPIVSDAVTAATKLHQQVAKYPTYTHVEHMVQDGIKVIAPTIAGQLPEGVKTTVATAVDHLDTLAVSGLDWTTTKVPALSSPTDELITATTEAATATAHTITTATWDVATTTMDYVASFTIAQTGLKMIDTGLSITEKVFHHLEPGQEWILKPLATIPQVATLRTYATPVVSKIRMVRRQLRAVRHAGRRHARLYVKSGKTTLGSVSMIGFVLELFHVNLILGMFGMALAPAGVVADGPLATSGKRKHDDLETTNEDETLAEKLSQEKMDAYESSQDPTYEPSEESEDSLEYNTDAEVSQEEVSQEETTTEVVETATEETTTTTHAVDPLETAPVETTTTAPVEELHTVVVDETTKVHDAEASLDSVEEMRGEESMDEMKTGESCEEGEARMEDMEDSLESVEVMRGAESEEEMKTQDIVDEGEVRDEGHSIESVEGLVEEVVEGMVEEVEGSTSEDVESVEGLVEEVMEGMVEEVEGSTSEEEEESTHMNHMEREVGHCQMDEMEIREMSADSVESSD
jgi:hypothetical protein